MKLLPCAQLLRASNRRIPELEHHCPTDYTFVQLADPQLGLLERYVEKRNPPFSWTREIALAKRACTIINNLKTKPKFVIVCGDLIDAEPDNPDRDQQCYDLLEIFSSLHPDIPVLVLPGNHDVGEKPDVNDLAAYRSVWGDDYYSYRCGSCKYIVINSQLYWNSSNCPNEAAEQDEWLQRELSADENKKASQLVVFQHIPFFCADVDEPDSYFNYPKKIRYDLLRKYHEAGVRFVFSGHLHYNGGGTWAPEGSSSPLQIISSSAVGVQLGSDKSGLRIVRVSDSPDTVLHRYFTFEELEQTPSLASEI